MCDTGSGTLTSQRKFGTNIAPKSGVLQGVLLSCRKPWFVGRLTKQLRKDLSLTPRMMKDVVMGEMTGARVL